MGESELRDPGTHLNEVHSSNHERANIHEPNSDPYSRERPDASRPPLQKIAQSAPTGRPLNLHAQMAHSPAVLAAYTSLRALTIGLGTLDPKVSWALTPATAATVGNDYMIGIASRFARIKGWNKALKSARAS
jgi:hypothetical protein